jgi:hypothetical protein
VEHTDHGDPGGSTDRRRFLRAGLTGAAIAALPVIARPGGASATTPPEEETTTTAPPARPTTEDAVLLRFMQTLELATRDLYDVAIACTAPGAETLEVLQVFREHHEAFAQGLSGMLGRVGALLPNAALLEEYTERFGAAPERLALAAAELENSLVSTYTDALDVLESTEGAALVASILTTEARHAQVMAIAAGIDDPEALLAPRPTPLSIDDYPPTLPSE